MPCHIQQQKRREREENKILELLMMMIKTSGNIEWIPALIYTKKKDKLIGRTRDTQ